MPARKTEVGRLPADVVDVEAVMRARPVRDRGVEAAHVIHAPAEVRAVEVAEQAIRQVLEVVLDHGTMEFLRDLLPRRAPFRDRLLHARIGWFRAERRPFADISHVRVDEDDVRAKRIKRGIAEHGILPPLVVLTLVEYGANAIAEEEQLKKRNEIMGSGAAKDGNALLQKSRPFQQRTPKRDTLTGKGLAIKRPAQQGRQLSAFVHADCSFRSTSSTSSGETETSTAVPSAATLRTIVAFAPSRLTYPSVPCIGPYFTRT